MADSILFKRGKYSSIAGLQIKQPNAIYFGAPDDDKHVGALWVGDKIIANTTKIADVQWSAEELSADTLERSYGSVDGATWTGTGWLPDDNKTYYIKNTEGAYTQVLMAEQEEGSSEAKSKETLVSELKTQLGDAASTTTLWTNNKGSFLYVGAPSTIAGELGKIKYTKITISSGQTVEGLESEIAAIASRVTALESRVGAIDGSISDINSSIGSIKDDISTINDKLEENDTTLTEVNSKFNAIDTAQAAQDASISALETSVGKEASGDDDATGLYKKIEDAISGSTVSLSPSDGSGLVYTLTQGEKTIGTINIPKDQFLKKVTYISSAESEGYEASHADDLPYIKFEWQLTDESDANSHQATYISVKDLVDTYTAGDDYVKVSDNQISLDIDGISDYVKNQITIPEVPEVEVKTSEGSGLSVTANTDGSKTTYTVDLLWDETQA